MKLFQIFSFSSYFPAVSLESNWKTYRLSFKIKIVTYQILKIPTIDVIVII